MAGLTGCFVSSAMEALATRLPLLTDAARGEEGTVSAPQTVLLRRGQGRASFSPVLQQRFGGYTRVHGFGKGLLCARDRRVYPVRPPLDE